jgi:hypothetical protein
VGCILNTIWATIKGLWSIIASLVTLALIMFVPIFAIAEIPKGMVSAHLFVELLLVALVAWGTMLTRFLDSGSQIAELVKKAHKRFVFPFGE